MATELFERFNLYLKNHIAGQYSAADSLDRVHAQASGGVNALAGVVWDGSRWCRPSPSRTVEYFSGVIVHGMSIKCDAAQR